MKQKVLNEKQHEILKRLEKVLKEASENNISFIYDTADGTITAYNNEGVADYGAFGIQPDNGDFVAFDWESGSMIECNMIDWLNSDIEQYYLSFE